MYLTLSLQHNTASLFQMENLTRVIDEDFNRIRELVFSIQGSSSLEDALLAADEILLSLDDLKNLLLRSIEDTQRSGATRVKSLVKLIKVPHVSPLGLTYPVAIFLAQTKHATQGAFGLVWSPTSESLNCSGLIACGDVTVCNALLSAILGVVTMAANWKIRSICFISRTFTGLKTALRSLEEDQSVAGCSVQLVERIKKHLKDNSISIVKLEDHVRDDYIGRHSALLASAQQLAHAALYPKSSIHK